MTSNYLLSGWTKKKLQTFSKAKLAPPKKVSWSLFGSLLLVWSTTAFWVMAKPLHLRNVLGKLMRCTENCNAHSQHLSTERAQFFSVTKPECTIHNQCFKSWTNWAVKFCLISHVYLISHQPATTYSSISTTLCRGNAPTTSWMQKMLSKSLSNPEAWIFYATRINKLVSYWQKYDYCNGSYFE